MQTPHAAHPERPRYGRERIAIGAGHGCMPSFFAPRSSNTPSDLIGNGGNGNGLLLGGSNGFPANPDTPMSHTTFV